MKTKLKLFKAIKLISSGLILAMIICSVAFAAPHREILNIELKTSKYMQMNQKITRLAVGDPEIATVVPLSNSAYKAPLPPGQRLAGRKGSYRRKLLFEVKPGRHPWQSVQSSLTLLAF